MTQEDDSSKDINHTARATHRKRFENDTFPHLAALWNMSMWLTMNSIKAEVLLMNTMSTAYRAWPVADTAGNKARLFRLLFGEFLSVDDRREQPNWVLPAGRNMAAPGVNSAFLAPRAPIGSREVAQLSSIPGMYIRGVVARVKVQPRSLLVLLLREGFSHSEITYITGLSEDSIRSGLNILRRLIPRCIVDHSESSSVAAECCDSSRGLSTSPGTDRVRRTP